jgi:hypothetical protein
MIPEPARWVDGAAVVYVAKRPVRGRHVNLKVGDPFPFQDAQIIRGLAESAGCDPDEAARLPFAELPYVEIRTIAAPPLPEAAVPPAAPRPAPEPPPPLTLESLAEMVRALAGAVDGWARTIERMPASSTQAQKARAQVGAVARRAERLLAAAPTVPLGLPPGGPARR